MAQDWLREGELLFPGETMPPAGTAVAGGFRILRKIESGGFGIAYQAVKQAGGDGEGDLATNLWLPREHPIVIKEFFPDFASRRGRTITVEGEDESHLDTFEEALHRFQREAERLCHLTCRRALRAARAALGGGRWSLAERIDQELDSAGGDPLRAASLVGRLRGDARAAAERALATSTLPIVYDYFVADENAYYVMEYLGGGTLKTRLTDDRRAHGAIRIEHVGVRYQLYWPWVPDRLSRFASAALDALEELHTGIPGQQLIHCDLKPGNIMFRSGDSDDPVLIDFGLARNVSDQKSRSIAAGTLGFAAPEIDPHLRARHGHGDDRFGGANVGPWTDIYAMAAILRMLATGVEASRLPSADQRTRVPAGEPDPVDLLPPFPDGFPERIACAIRHGMALQRSDRPQSIAEWREAFEFDEAATAINIRTVIAPANGDARMPVEPELPTKTITLTKTPTATVPLAVAETPPAEVRSITVPDTAQRATVIADPTHGGYEHDAVDPDPPPWRRRIWIAGGAVFILFALIAAIILQQWLDRSTIVVEEPQIPPPTPTPVASAAPVDPSRQQFEAAIAGGERLATGLWLTRQGKRGSNPITENDVVVASITYSRLGGEAFGAAFKDQLTSADAFPLGRGAFYALSYGDTAAFLFNMAEVQRADPALHARLLTDPSLPSDSYVRAEVTVKPCIDPALSPLEGTRLRMPCMAGKWAVDFKNGVNTYSGSWLVAPSSNSGPMNLRYLFDNVQRTAAERCTARIKNDVNIACSNGKADTGEVYDADQFVLRWAAPNLLTGEGTFVDTYHGNKREPLTSVSFRKSE